MSKVLIVGGGAAGMLASIFAARNGHEVHVYEKNEKLGKKLYITGKGRCNLTNACDMDALFASVRTNSRFLYSAFYGFTNQDAMTFFEEEGLKIKIERGERVFPLSDKSADVLDTLRRSMRRAGVEIHLNTEVKELILEDGQARGLILADKTRVDGDGVIVATGGLSYPVTGSTGDGYRFAKEAGHKVTDCIPSLTPFNIREDFVKELQGLSLKNVELRIYNGKKEVFREFGEMMFTHFGITGPLVLTASSFVGTLAARQELRAVLDLKPALSEEQLDQRVLREFDANPNKSFKNVIGSLFPAKLTPVMIGLSGMDPDKKVHDISREERLNFVRLTKGLSVTVTGLRDYKEAIITKGGVAVKEINPSTMESKLVKGLYFIGEVLDLDAVTGGFNLQIAWSTAYAAGNAI
ncbi:NAD(P)/FAD-dependent oxidoreductase [Laedolimicola ammoniilytica]|uniref:NAD(P)/FAD-dependent oxidoreductase n=1 Tax=Laedolimicola ammoniilytica TaxID=2981771 RepID=A0ABT2RUI2_9FIRM|nr:NAD(P)/FAD-dependent oxidoreductase [Laedolimicola ammoniilytica]MCU6695951.1 NAD(P)/FAD-dependent oxidoreductase [Laedolimicola ammoniilytica]SCH32919.1 putative FAD-binding dehydrogenase [uncultured Clostridium sp.]